MIDASSAVSNDSNMGRPAYPGRRLMLGADHAVSAVRAAVEPLQAEYINQQITRMNAALQDDAKLAIGTAKEFVETGRRADWLRLRHQDQSPTSNVAPT